jgi:hypothetical protein
LAAEHDANRSILHWHYGGARPWRVVLGYLLQEVAHFSPEPS